MQGLEEDEEHPCGSQQRGWPAVCINEVGHTGRHRYRALSFERPLN